MKAKFADLSTIDRCCQMLHVISQIQEVNARRVITSVCRGLEAICRNRLIFQNRRERTSPSGGYRRKRFSWEWSVIWLASADQMAEHVFINPARDTSLGKIPKDSRCTKTRKEGSGLTVFSSSLEPNNSKGQAQERLTSTAKILYLIPFCSSQNILIEDLMRVWPPLAL